MTAGLRERKKQRVRAHIADTAARLFGERGFEQVSVADVAAAADVSLQTVYNYFGSKRDLVLDREDEITEALVRAVTERPAKVSAIAAARPVVLDEIAELRTRTRKQAAGDLPVLCAASAEVRRYGLEARDRQADRVAEAIAATDTNTDTGAGTAAAASFAAKAQAAALLSVLQSFVDHVGRRVAAGSSPRAVADEVEPLVVAALDDLEHRYAPRRRPARRS